MPGILAPGRVLTPGGCCKDPSSDGNVEDDGGAARMHWLRPRRRHSGVAAAAPRELRVIVLVGEASAASCCASRTSPCIKRQRGP